MSPKIYHIIHKDNLPSVIKDDHLYSDAYMRQTLKFHTAIGMNRIKDRRLTIPIATHQSLNVGECVPFYFCSRSVMLYMLHMGNHQDIHYLEGQENIVHLVADMKKTVEWAKSNDLRWAFTTSNASSRYFDSYSDLNKLNEIDWEAVNSKYWSECREQKQAEFLVENRFTWSLIEEIGVFSYVQQEQVYGIIQAAVNKLNVKIQREWYY